MGATTELLHGRLRPGDRIVEVNGRVARTANELERALSFNPRHSVLVVRRGNARIYVAIPLD